jgi:hypothetical protein
MAGKKKTTFELMRAKILRERRKKLQINKFEPEEKSIRGRIVEFMLHCADNYPHSIITYEEITQAIFGLGRVPDSRSKHVKSVRGQMSSAGKRLLELHDKTLITCRGVGARASVDNVDKLEQSLPKEAENFRRASAKLAKVSESIDELKLDKEISAVIDPAHREELEIVAGWWKELQQKIVKGLKKPATAKALLPPPAPSS